MCSKRRDQAFVGALWALLVFAIAGFVSAGVGCTPPSEGPDVQAVPLMTAESATATGSIELETPAGPLVFGLDGKLLAGEASGITLRRVDIDVAGDGQLNGQPASVAIELRNNYSGEWTHCLTARLGAMGWAAKLRYPLSESCGPPGLLGLEMRPFPLAAATVDE